MSFTHAALGTRLAIRGSWRKIAITPSMVAVYLRFMTAITPRLLVEMFPVLATELQQLLVEQGESELAAQVPGLTVVERCRCGDDFCGTFYVLPKPVGAYGPNHRNVDLSPKDGMLILDVLANRIAAVEVLYRDEIRQRLLVEFP
jgi:hypothetical protein